MTADFPTLGAFVVSALPDECAVGKIRSADEPVGAG